MLLVGLLCGVELMAADASAYPEVAAAEVSGAQTEEKGWLLSFDNPREVTGVVIGGIVINLTLATLFLLLLRKEWNKHKTARKPADEKGKHR